MLLFCFFLLWEPNQNPSPRKASQIALQLKLYVASRCACILSVPTPTVHLHSFNEGTACSTMFMLVASVMSFANYLACWFVKMSAVTVPCASEKKGQC